MSISWNRSAEQSGSRKPLDLAKLRIWHVIELRNSMSSRLASWNLSICWCLSPRSLTGLSISASARAMRASLRASPRSLLAFESVISFTSAGFATSALKPMSSKWRFIQRQCVPVSKTTGHDLSNFAKHSEKPSFVVGHVVSTRTLRSPPSLVITQIFDLLSLTSTPIVVEYSMSVPFCLGCSSLHLHLDECAYTDMIPNDGN